MSAPLFRRLSLLLAPLLLAACRTALAQGAAALSPVERAVQKARPAAERALQLPSAQDATNTPRQGHLVSALPELNIRNDEIAPAKPAPGAAAVAWANRLESRIEATPTALAFAANMADGSHALIRMRLLKDSWAYAGGEDDGTLVASLVPPSPESIAQNAETEQPSTPVAIVNVKGLNLSFIAVREKDELMLRSLWDAPKYGFSADKPIQVNQAFAAMRNEIDVQVKAREGKKGPPPPR